MSTTFPENTGNPWDELVIAPHTLTQGMSEPVWLDAVYEDANGRLPHEPGYVHA